ncbi:SRPBCC family protein [Cellulomonas edaphi]|uniref:SRPBCC family protein n=1 Tax=Cellulomonas edaphi TaxID=3053468 RepID=A0ABT7S8G7_9CELL|nr:SRPBCC family protein [Cellulomons edaphi]MDM7831915.1 SRPBCC family protein [Cellulomons edaphi]
MSNDLHVNAPEGVPFIDITREFDAPVAKVFEAHAKPELVAQWMGPRDLTMDIKEWDFVSGGRWSYVSTGRDGEAFGFRGMFHTVRPDEFAIQTFEFEGYPDVVAIESITFEDLGADRTRIRIHSVYPTLEARDGMVASGMEGGVKVGYERLDELVA